MLRITLSPDPEGQELLFEILTKFCESKLVGRIISTKLFIDLEHQFPTSALGRRYPPYATYKSPLAYGFFYGWRDFDSPSEEFPLQSGLTAEQNKIDNLYVETEDKARIRLHKRASRSHFHHISLLPAGLQGLLKAIQIVRDFSADNHSTQLALPPIFRKSKLTNFSISVTIIWDSWIKFVEGKTEKEILRALDWDGELGEILDKEGNYIFIDSRETKVEFWSCVFHDDLHYEKLEAFIKQTWGDKFQIEYDFE